MGLAISLVRETISSLKALYAEICESNTAFSAVLSRISSSPSVPVANPTRSFWLKDPLFPELADRKSENLPGSVEVVIIGSGISGTAVAWGLLSGGGI